MYSGKGWISAVKKKIKKSHDRNRLRRFLRESYRINKQSLFTAATDRNLQLDILFTLTPAGYERKMELDSTEINDNIKRLLYLITRTLEVS